MTLPGLPPPGTTEAYPRHNICDRARGPLHQCQDDLRSRLSRRGCPRAPRQRCLIRCTEDWGGSVYPGPMACEIYAGRRVAPPSEPRPNCHAAAIAGRHSISADPHGRPDDNQQLPP